MTDPARISEIVGIDSKEHDSESVWPLNFVLVVLGAAILAVAFSFLDMAEPRPLYNPWTYAIATPVALMGLSAMLSLVVSRLVEKSMQLAFLLSVLIHLVLMVCAMNVVIFSRMWPDMLDSLAQQREQLKRETLRAKQYHRVSISKQSGQRPDYLKPVTTEHQPTDVENAEAPQLALARSDRANLISPSPKIALSHSPSLLERKQSATSLPSRSEQVASLSRSEIAAPRVANSSPTFESPAMDVSQPQPLSPSAAALARKSDDRRSSELEQSPALPLEVRGPPSDALDRPSSLSPAPQLQQPQTPSTIDRQRLADLRPRQRAADQLDAPQAPASNTSPTEVSPSSLSASQRRNTSAQVADVGPTSRLPAPAASSAINALVNNSLASRAAQPALTPLPAVGDSATAFPRNMAGGDLGTAAPSSMPVRGIEDVGLTEPTPNVEARINSIVNDSHRRSSQAATLSQLPNVGTLGANAWNGTANLSAGTDGQSLSQLTRNAGQGSAGVQDTAQLSGTERDLVRSALGRSGMPSPAAVPGIDSRSDSASPSSGTLDFSGANPTALSASGATIGRSTSGVTSIASEPTELLSAPLASNNSLEQTLGAIARVENASDIAGSTSSVPSAPGQLLKSNALTSTFPGQSTISVPELLATADSAADAGAQSPQMPGAALSRRSASDRRVANTDPLPANLLAIEGELGRGGLASTPGVVGALLNRRDSALDRWTPPQLEAQHLARQDVGGPLAAGQVPLPKPAFQQRIDRLKDRNPQDESSIEPQTELAIERGLEFLAKHQRPDGSWRLQDFDTPVLMRSDTAATGLALLAFQGAGYTHNQFKYAATVDKALQFLVQHQSAGGDLYIPQDPASDQNAWLYSHAIATLALCEAMGMTQDDKLRPAAQKAIDFMVASQDPQRGGWRYRPGAGADTSVTGWFMMAFKSGQLAGLKVPEPTMRAIEKFIDASQSPEGEPHLYRYNPFAADTPQQRHGLQPTSVMTSVGLLMRLYFGWKRDRAEMMAGADYLLQHPPEHGTPTASRRDTYYWYYATQFMFHMRGQWWKKWHDQLYPLLINTQITEGELSGSWDPNYPTPDLWARYGGRHYVTTLNLLSLEVSYRHLPLYEATAQ